MPDEFKESTRTKVGDDPFGGLAPEFPTRGFPATVAERDGEETDPRFQVEKLREFFHRRVFDLQDSARSLQFSSIRYSRYSFWTKSFSLSLSVMITFMVLIASITADTPVGIPSLVDQLSQTQFFLLIIGFFSSLLVLNTGLEGFFGFGRKAIAAERAYLQIQILVDRALFDWTAKVEAGEDTWQWVEEATKVMDPLFGEATLLPVYADLDRPQADSLIDLINKFKK